MAEHLTDMEKMTILEMLQRDVTFAEIARNLGKSRSAIWMEVEKNGKRAGYTPKLKEHVNKFSELKEIIAYEKENAPTIKQKMQHFTYRAKQRYTKTLEQLHVMQLELDHLGIMKKNLDDHLKALRYVINSCLQEMKEEEIDGKWAAKENGQDTKDNGPI